MKTWMIYAVGAGLCWGLGGYFEKAGLRRAELPPIAGITIRTAVALLDPGAPVHPRLEGGDASQPTCGRG